MPGLFFRNRDISVSVQAAQRFQFGFLNKSIIVTDEADIDIKKFTTLEELTTYLTDNVITAPNLVAAVTAFLGQVDASGNPVLAEYYYVIGKVEADSNADVSLITAAIEAAKDANDFYNLVPTFESVAWNTWFATWGNTNRRISGIYTETQAKALTDPEKSARIFGIYDGSTTPEYRSAAWSGRVASSAELIAFKWKTLTGQTVDSLTDAEVSTLEDAGWNGYRNVRGLGETTGSRTTANVSGTASYIDTIIIRDNVVYNVANALHQMFKQNDIVPMGEVGRALVRQAISQALNFAGSVGLINEFEGGGYQFEVFVPEITSAMRSARELTDVEFTFVPTIPMEKITVTGQELLEWVN